ncbi:aromatic acid exporter family protein, partial [Clostridium sp. AF36-18BH]
QCVILKRIYADIIRLTTTPEQGKALADFIRQTADEFEEQNNVETLLSELETLHHYYEQQPLPVTRHEFENRSMLYHILEDMKAFLDIKKDFITAR